jgi:hypothetical protein
MMPGHYTYSDIFPLHNIKYEISLITNDKSQKPKEKNEPNTPPTRTSPRIADSNSPEKVTPTPTISIVSPTIYRKSGKPDCLGGAFRQGLA